MLLKKTIIVTGAARGIGRVYARGNDTLDEPSLSPIGALGGRLASSQESLWRMQGRRFCILGSRLRGNDGLGVW